MAIFRRFLILCLVAVVGCASPRADGPSLWRLRDADSEIYLFGTVHVLPPALKWRTPRIDAAFARADTIWFETPTDDAAGAKIAAIVAVSGRNPAGVTLSSRLQPADRARLQRVARKVGVSVEALEPLRPWLAALQISLAELQRQGHDADSGVEHVLEAEARTQGKRKAYFETAEDQISIFSTLPPADEDAFLVATLRQVEEDAEDPAELARLWASGQSRELGAKVEELAREAGPRVADALLDRRNQRFADAIAREMQGHGVAFVAVGAAHMTGPKGVPALLAARGFKVEGPGPFPMPSTLAPKP